MSVHNDKGEYDNDMPKKVEVPSGNGYPNPRPKTQTKKMNGTGAATKGTHYSKFSN